MILVAGATGSLGGRIVHGLLTRGEEVRALARPSSQWTPLQHAGAQVVHGDLKDASSLERACEGASILISTASASKRNDDSVQNVDLQGNRNLIDAARNAGVGHVIFVSTVGAAVDHPVPLFRAKAETAQRLSESGLSFTILQPNAFMDVWFGMLIEAPALSGNPVTLVGESRRRHSFVAEGDVAAFAVAATHVPAARNATIVIGGPEALSLRDVVRAYEHALGQEIAVRSVDPGDPIPGLPEPVWALAAALETFDSVIPMEDTAETYGIVLTNARDFARSRVGKATAL